MNFLSRIIIELAQEFRIPDTIEKKLFQRLYMIQKTKEKMIMEKSDDGANKSLSDKGTSR